MGIINVTPDSFSDGGIHASRDAACQHGRELIKQGATIIDVGGESTRPGSQEVSLEEELDRVLPVVTCLASEGHLVSIDTRHAHVAQACVQAGAVIINDVSGFRDPDMVQVATQCNAGIIIMHMLGEPKSMQVDPVYVDVVQEISDYLLAQAALLEAAGVAPQRIAIDPGPGFGKTYAHNLALLKATPQLASLGYPLVAGWSRKAFLGKLTGVPVAADRVAGSVTAALYAARQGARILRVHDVAPTAQALQVAAALEPFAAHPQPAAPIPTTPAPLANTPAAAATTTTTPARVFIALGANMGNSAATLKKAAEKIAALPGVTLTRSSGLYQSQPAYRTQQDPFCNAVIQIATTLEPKDLLKALQAIEDDLGRVRSLVNGPRAIDLDIIDYQGVCSDDPDLLLPHPLALERDFVVTPLLEIAPNLVLADGSVVTRQGVELGEVTARLDVGDNQLAAAPKAPADKVGMLSLCATPIGNLGDITQRVIDALAQADLVLAEDTRVTRRLLSHLNLRPPLERCDANTIRQRTPGIINRLQQGSRVVLVSDAGMPGISDPGSVLVEAALAAGCALQVLPGASAVLTAVVASGFASTSFYFGGFLPRKPAQIRASLEQLGSLDATLVFFESPHRAAASLAVIAQVFPQREVVLARELTKIHEEVLRANAQELADQVSARLQQGQALKGEVTLVIGPPQKQQEARIHQDRYAAKRLPG